MKQRVEMKSALQNSIEKAADANDCPLIEGLAKGVCGYFEELMEETYNGGDTLFLLTLVKLYEKEMYEEALSFLSATFCLCHIDAAGELVASVASTKKDLCMKTFLALFLSDHFDDLDTVFEERMRLLN